MKLALQCSALALLYYEEMEDYDDMELQDYEDMDMQDYEDMKDSDDEELHQDVRYLHH